MSADLGRLVKYGLGKGADVSASNWITQLDFNLRARNENVVNESAFGRLERTNTSNVIRKWAEGDLEAKLTSDTGGLLLLGVFGSVSTADNADSNAAVKDHTFTLNQSVDGQPMTFIRKDSIETQKFTSGRFGETEIQMALDDYVKITSSIMAKVGQTTTASPALAAESEFVAKHFSVRTASNAAGLSGATDIATVESFNLTINPNIEADYAAGSAEPYGFSSRGYEISFEMSKRYVDTTFRDAFLNGTSMAMQATLLNSDVTIGAAANPKLVLTAYNVTITDWDKSEDIDAPATETVTGTIHFSPTDGKALQAILTNTTSSY